MLCLFKINEQLYFSNEQLKKTNIKMITYLDCNATTPIEPKVIEVMNKYFCEEYGNAGSRTHEFGNNAKKAVQDARRKVFDILKLKTGDKAIFTSGATESNNMAILGLAKFAESSGKKHIITTAIEHKAVLEPLKHLEEKNFKITYLPIGNNGKVCLDTLKSSLTDDTVLVSIMQVNNETGVIQPIDEICNILKDHEAYFHTDAAQGFGKNISQLQNKRIDMISISGHKIYGPKGIGILVLKRRGYNKIPITPIIFGGGQEEGYRPGTLPVPLIAGLGEAVSIAQKDFCSRKKACLSFKAEAISCLNELGAVFNGDINDSLFTTLNFSIPSVDSEAIMLAMKDFAALSNGSACTSQNYTPSHVLTAMGLSDDIIKGAVRMSWCHMTIPVDWNEFSRRINSLRN